MLNQLTIVLSDENTNIRSLEAKTRGSRRRRRRNDRGCARQEATGKAGGAMRRISGVRDVETAFQLTDRSRTHRHFQIQRHQNRLEGWPPQRIRLDVPARQMSLRHLHRRPRHAAAPAGGETSRSRCIKPTLKMLGVEPVGNYAIRINWSDGHNTGIYSYDHFRRICPCAECKNQIRKHGDAVTPSSPQRCTRSSYSRRKLTSIVRLPP